MIKTYKPTLGFYTAQIEAGLPFSFIRYGDGEWSAILGDRGRTSSKSHDLTLPVLRRDIMDSLSKPRTADNCYYALRETSVNQPEGGVRGRNITKWLKVNTKKLTWHDCTVFYKASRKGKLYPFVHALRNSPLPVVLVGPRRLRKLSPSFCEFADFVEIPNRDAYTKKSAIIRQVMRVAERQPSLFLFVGGPAAKCLIYKLFQPLGASCTLIDVGSLLDIYAGKKSRRYHHSMTPETIRQNLTGQPPKTRTS